MLDGVLDRLADGDAEAAGAIRIVLQKLAAIFGLVARAGMHRRAPGVHQHPAIRLLVVAHLDHVDVALQAEQLARQRQRRTPLARARLGGEPLGAGDLVVIRLRDGGVGLVAAGGAGAFVFVVNVRRGLAAPSPAAPRAAAAWAATARKCRVPPREPEPNGRDTFPASPGSPGKSPASASGGIGCFVPGCSGGGSGSGKSARRLYHCWGMSACVNANRVGVLIIGIWFEKDYRRRAACHEK